MVHNVLKIIFIIIWKLPNSSRFYTRQGIKGLDHREYDVGKSQVELFISKEAYIINVISIRMLYSTT